MQPEGWLTAEQAAKYLGLKNAKAFENLVVREGVPTYYPSKRQPRWSRKGLDHWILARERALKHGVL